MNKFFTDDDFSESSYFPIVAELEDIYYKTGRKSFDPKTDTYNETGRKGELYWSRKVEYPWALISSEAIRLEGRNVKKQPKGLKQVKVLDVGCGASPLLPYLAKRGYDCYGITPDPISDKYHDGLHGYIPDLGSRIDVDIEFKRVGMEAIPYADNTFDKVYCISVIEHIEEDIMVKGAKEMARVLKKGGLLTITMDTHNPEVELPRAKKIIEASGLTLYGETNFDFNDTTTCIKGEDKYRQGRYWVFGFVLEKK
jgi:SAM-dependent methyltransferase